MIKKTLFYIFSGYVLL